MSTLERYGTPRLSAGVSSSRLHPAVEAVDGFDHGQVVLDGHIVGNGVTRAAGVTAARRADREDLSGPPPVVLGYAPVAYLALSRLVR